MKINIDLFALDVILCFAQDGKEEKERQKMETKS